MFHVSHRGDLQVLKAFATVAAVMDCTNLYRLVQYGNPTHVGPSARFGLGCRPEKISHAKAALARMHI